MGIDWKARAEAAEAEAKDACTAADEAEHRASLAIDSAQELARCVLQATQSQGSWVDHPPMGDWVGVVDGVSALRARAEAAEARAAQAEADARLMLAAYYGADSASITRFGLGDGLLSEGDLRRLDALRDAMFYTSEADTAAAMLRVLTTASA